VFSSFSIILNTSLYTAIITVAAEVMMMVVAVGIFSKFLEMRKCCNNTVSGSLNPGEPKKSLRYKWTQLIMVELLF
jgi:hypothetical protein